MPDLGDNVYWEDTTREGGGGPNLHSDIPGKTVDTSMFTRYNKNLCVTY